MCLHTHEQEKRRKQQRVCLPVDSSRRIYEGKELLFLSPQKKKKEKRQQPQRKKKTTQPDHV